MQPLLKLGPCCYEKETYSQYRMRMHYVTGYLGTHFIRILSVQKKLLKKKKNQRSLREKLGHGTGQHEEVGFGHLLLLLLSSHSVASNSL